MEGESEESGTKLPEIKNNANYDRNGDNKMNGIRSADNPIKGSKSGRSDNMSHHSSRKSVPVRSMRSTKRLADVKKDRKQVEKDAELLANRIALLKQEEMRTWKKIEETRKRAKDVLEMKKKNEE